MSGTISILPVSYDVSYIIQKVGLFNHYGYETKEDGIHFVYPVANYDAVMAVINSYEVDYCEVLLPKILADIDRTRKVKVLAFDFMGMQIIMDTTTIANLTAAVVGLDRQPDRTHINWQIGAGKFASIPRAVMYAMADQAFLYVQSCFDHAKALTETALAAKNISELNAINVESGWPSDPVPPTAEPDDTPPAGEETDTPEEPEAPQGSDGGDTDEPSEEPTDPTP